MGKRIASCIDLQYACVCMCVCLHTHTGKQMALTGLFEEMDADGNGHIDFDEFKKYVEKYGLVAPTVPAVSTVRRSILQSCNRARQGIQLWGMQHMWNVNAVWHATSRKKAQARAVGPAGR